MFTTFLRINAQIVKEHLTQLMWNVSNHLWIRWCCLCWHQRGETASKCFHKFMMFIIIKDSKSVLIWECFDIIYDDLSGKPFHECSLHVCCDKNTPTVLALSKNSCGLSWECRCNLFNFPKNLCHYLVDVDYLCRCGTDLKG